MSDSSLSPLSQSHAQSPELPGSQINNTLTLQTVTRTPQLPATSSALFSKQLFSRILLETTPPSVQFACLQPSCEYSPSTRSIKDNTTSNLWKHLERVHPLIYHAVKQPISSSQGSACSTPSEFFLPRQNQSQPPLSKTKYRELLLSFLVNNNLPL
jgi:hypothetical protein